ncbi:urease accessory protein UreF [Kyrpidia spormannii]|uniref:Urease accessory protein UreF n=1 Tax=Kyrpidia spormannii TaxID=2055160 RepID=A0A2K8N361_9BACL|nr:urease accessory UreF family protein [Kyrpidia spormannii]ATY83949.1 urease accessory protein UreF [Kyrpidia spormannii]
MRLDLRGLPLLDSAFPTGAFAHSFGLETAVREGRVSGPGELRRWLEASVWAGTGRTDGVGVFCAHAVVSGGGLTSPGSLGEERLQEVDRRLTLIRLARESREGSVKIGRRYVRLAEAVYPEAGIERYRRWIEEGGCFGQAPVVHGWLWAHLGGGAEDAVAGYLYAGVVGVVQCALRLSVVGQTDAQRTIRDLLPDVEAVAGEIVRLRPEPWQMGAACVFQEVAGIRHETLYSRLFMS